jgi:hypothetical protein
MNGFRASPTAHLRLAGLFDQGCGPPAAIVSRAGERSSIPLETGRADLADVDHRTGRSRAGGRDHVRRWICLRPSVGESPNRPMPSLDSLIGSSVGTSGLRGQSKLIHESGPAHGRHRRGAESPSTGDRPSPTTVSSILARLRPSSATREPIADLHRSAQFLRVAQCRIEWPYGPLRAAGAPQLPGVPSPRGLGNGEDMGGIPWSSPPVGVVLYGAGK